MNPGEYFEEEDSKPPKLKRNRVDFAKSLEQLRMGFINKNKQADMYNMQAMAEDILVKKEFNDMACELPGLPRSTFLMVFSPDGTIAASTHGNHNIYITDVKTGKNIKVLVGHPRTPWCIAFHPTSNQIVASGCLGGQVRIWDLSATPQTIYTDIGKFTAGGSEMWTAESQTVIASIAFHPDDRVLVIATYNQLYFWDWSKPEPFMHISTASVKEKVRYVAFDKMGYKLITGISNDNSQPRRPTPSRILANQYLSSYALHSSNVNHREPPSSLSNVPERERRITACYRNLVYEYEHLVRRYLQIYRPPTMVDQGTDPMEMEDTSNASSSSSNIRPSRLAPSTGPFMGVNPSPLRRRRNSLIDFHRRYVESLSNSSQSRSVAPRFRIARAPIRGINIENSNGTVTLDSLRHEPTYRIVSTVVLHRLHTFSLLERTDIDSSIPPTESELQVIRTAIDSGMAVPPHIPRPPDLLLPPMGYESGDLEQSRDFNERHANRLSRLSSLREVIRTIRYRRNSRMNRMNNTIHENNARTTENNSRTNDGPLLRSPNPWPSNDNSSNSASADFVMSDTVRTLHEMMRNHSHPYFCPPSERTNNQQSRRQAEDETDGEEEASTPLNINSSDPLLSSVMSDSNDGGEGTSSTADRNRAEKRPLVRTNSDESSSSSVPTKRINNALDQSIEEQQSQNSLVLSGLQLYRRCEMPSNRDEGINDINSRLPSSSNGISNCAGPSSSISSSSSRGDSPEPGPSNANSDGRNSRCNNARKKICMLSFSKLNLNKQSAQGNEGEGNGSQNTNDLNANASSRNDSNVPSSCARTNLPCTSTNRSSPLNSPNVPLNLRRRFLSHISAFCPPRVNSSYIRTIRPRRQEMPNTRTRQDHSPQNSSFALDEVINYSEMQNAEGENSNSSESRQNPLPSPGADIPNIPVNETAEELYQSLVRHLEMSLSEVCNIPMTGRLGEASDTLSNFSARLEEILEQSQTILTNMGSSIDQMDAGLESPSYRRSDTPPRISFNDRNFYVRENNRTEPLDEAEAEGEARDPISTDHSYPLRQDGYPSSLFNTVSHIQTQARLLRQQVDSIERIVSAMLEVTQLQTIRHILHNLRHFYQLPNSEPTYRNPDPDNDPDEPFRPPSRADMRPDDEPEYMSPGLPRGHMASSTRPYARCIFLMRTRRNPGMRRPPSRDRSRRYLYRRQCPNRVRPQNRNAGDPEDDLDPFAFAGMDTSMPTLLRRLENYLLEHARLMGQSVPASNSSNLNGNADVGEYLLNLRLNNCRIRANNIFSQDLNNPRVISDMRNENGAVCRDGRGRYPARQTLVVVIDVLLRFAETHRNDPHGSIQTSHLLEYIELSLLLSEVLLLQIVDSIPPPPSTPNRSSNSQTNSEAISRSIRMMRVSINQASDALERTYTARRNALLPAGGDRIRRMELIREIHDCLRNIQRRGGQTTPINLNRNTSSVREPANNSNGDNSAQGSSSSSPSPRPYHFMSYQPPNRRNRQPEESSSSQEHPSSRLYRTNNVNLLGNERLDNSVSRSRPWDVPLVQVNDMPINDNNYSYPWQNRNNNRQQNARMSERIYDWRVGHPHGLFRPRFLHPIYGGSGPQANPFEQEDIESREQMFEGEFITTVAHNHRIQMWRFSTSKMPNISNPMKNIVVGECKIHNDASVDIASDGSMLVTLLPSSGYLNITNRLGVYSLNWETLGQCLYITSLEHNAVSVSLSPLSRHLVVGLATRRISIIQNDKWTMARIFSLDNQPDVTNGRLSAIRQLEQNRDTTTMSVNCIRWLPISGHGLCYATNTGQLRVLS